MQHKIIILLVTFILFSLSGITQATSTSEHPLLDKYYPQKKVDTNKAIVNEIKSQTTPPSMKVQPAVVTSSSQVKPVPVGKSETAVKVAHVEEISPAIESPVITAPSPISVSVSTVAPEVTTAAVATSPVITKLNIDTTRNVAPKKIQPKSAPEDQYNRSRLGSSSKLYDTYKKNSNGAGSVTTNPK